MIKKLAISATLAFVASFSAAEAGCRLQPVSGANQALPAKKVNLSLLNQALVAEVNYARCKSGRPALQGSPALSKQAESHSKWMARAHKLSHKGRGSLTSRLKGSGIRYRTGAENIGVFHVYQLDGVMTKTVDTRNCRFAFMDGRAVPRHSYASLAKMSVDYWMASAGHRKNLLNRKIQLLGNGSGIDTKAAKCGKIYMTQIFAG